MESERRGNEKLFYNVIKCLRNKRQDNLKYIKAKNTDIITDDTKIMEKILSITSKYGSGTQNKLQVTNKGKT